MAINVNLPFSQDGPQLTSASRQLFTRRQRNQYGLPVQVPFSIRINRDEDFWQFPLEPKVYLMASTHIAKTLPSRASHGSIKEKWQVDDVRMQISGVFIDHPNFPLDDSILMLRRMYEADSSIEVECPITKRLGVTHIITERLILPPTAGELNQRYLMWASSDFTLPSTLDTETRPSNRSTPVGSFVPPLDEGIAPVGSAPN